MKTYITDKTVHTTLTSDDVAELIHEKYGVPKENIMAHYAIFWFDLVDSNDSHCELK